MATLMTLDDEQTSNQEDATGETPVVTESAEESAPRKRRKTEGRELTDAQIAERDRVTGLLRDSHSGLDAAIEAYNTALEELQAPVQAALDSLNEALAAARDLRDDVVNSIDDYVSERSERWQSSDAAQAVESYKGEWEYAELDDREIEFPAAIEMPDLDADVLDSLPEAAEV